MTSEEPPGRPRVLLVEDDGITARYLRDCLHGAGIPEPITAASGEDALALASAERPDLVLMDVVLRGAMDGIEAAGRIRERTGAQVVFVTARDDEDTRRRAAALRARGYLVKPFVQQDLTVTVARALDLPASGMDEHGRPYLVAAAPQSMPPLESTPSLRYASASGGAPSAPAPLAGRLPRWATERGSEKLCVMAREMQRQNEELALAQRRVEAERRRYRELFDLAPDGYLATDCAGVIREANQGAGDLLGVDPAQLVGKPLALFVPYGGHEGYCQLLERLEHDQQRRQWETPLRPRGREPFDASLTIIPVQDAHGAAALSWVIRDISTHAAAERALRQARDDLEARVRERTAELVRLNAALQAEVAEPRRTEASLLESRQFLQSIADTIPSMLYAYDLRAGAVTYVNSHRKAMLGHAIEEALGLDLGAAQKAVHPDDRARAAEHLTRVLAADHGEVVESALRVRHADGSWRWLRLRDVVSGRDADGTPVRCVGAADDVTEQHAAEAALVRAERLADIGRLAASFAHEINNPLQGVLGCLGLLEEALEEGRDAARYLEVAQREVRRAVRVVGQLRDLGRQARAAVEPVPTNLGEIVAHVLTVTEKRCGDQGVAVAWEAPDALPQVMADPDAIQQVLLNLVINALDAMLQGGTLRIGAHRTASPLGACVTVADDGPGIDPDLLPRLFESFATTKAEGLGLGLYISRGIIEQHGGRIDVETEPGLGTTFSVWLPAMHGPRQTPPR